PLLLAERDLVPYARHLEAGRRELSPRRPDALDVLRRALSRRRGACGEQQRRRRQGLQQPSPVHDYCDSAGAAAFRSAAIRCRLRRRNPARWPYLYESNYLGYAAIYVAKRMHRRCTTDPTRLTCLLSRRTVLPTSVRVPACVPCNCRANQNISGARRAGISFSRPRAQGEEK